MGGQTETWRSQHPKQRKTTDVEGGWRVENGRRRFVAGEAGNWRNASGKERELSSKKFRNAAQGHYIGMKKSNPQRKCNKEMVWRNSSPVVTNTTFTANLLDELATLSKEKVPAKVPANPSRFSAKAQAFYGGLRPKVLAARTAAAKDGSDGIPEKTDKPSRRSPLANLLTPSEKRRQRFKEKLKGNTIKTPTLPSRKHQAETPKEEARSPQALAAQQPKQQVREVQAKQAQPAPSKATEPTPEKKLTLKPSLAQAQCEEGRVAQLCTQEKVEVTLSPARALSRDESLAVAVAGAATAVVGSIGVVPDPARNRLGFSLLVMLCAVAAACGYGLFTDLVYALTPRKTK
jgi:hypothetical protein